MALKKPGKVWKHYPESKNTGFTFRGSEIYLCKQPGTPRKGLVAKGIQKGMFPEEKKIEAATIYAATGSLQRAAELSGVPVTVVRGWRQTDEFQALLKEVWTENNEKIDAKFTAIIEKSLDAIVDRLDNGDFFVRRDGQLARKPISAKELSLVQAINVDKRQLLRGLPTSRSESTGQVEDKTVSRLEKLAETFENLARFGRKPKTIEVVDAEVVEIEDKTSAEGQSQAV